MFQTNFKSPFSFRINSLLSLPDLLIFLRQTSEDFTGQGETSVEDKLQRIMRGHRAA